MARDLGKCPELLAFAVHLLFLASNLQYLPICSLSRPILRFNPDGRFKILQIADMHYANGASTQCKDILPSQLSSGCSDLNTTAFVRRLISAEKPDLIVYSGDNIFGRDCTDPRASMDAAFAPAIEAQIPWAAVLGNHDQESALMSRREVMHYITTLQHTVSQMYPNDTTANDSTDEIDDQTIGRMRIDGFGNYQLQVRGAPSSPLENRTVLNVYLLDSGDYSRIRRIGGYGWIQESQKQWFLRSQEESVEASKGIVAVPSLVYFHIPLVETRIATGCSITGVKQESIGCARVNSGFLSAMRRMPGPFAIFNGHDHVNDFCGDLAGDVKVCYAGGTGYHAYGKAGWDRRARIVELTLLVSDRSSTSTATEGNRSGVDPTVPSSPDRPQLPGVARIVTWKRLDSHSFPTIDYQVLWSSTELPRSASSAWWSAKLLLLLVAAFLVCLLLALSHWKSLWPFGTNGIIHRTQRYVPVPRS